MEAEIGDEILVRSMEPGHSGRVATVVGLSTADGLPRYVVHWLAGDYDAVITPGPGTRVEVRQRSHATYQSLNS